MNTSHLLNQLDAMGPCVEPTPTQVADIRARVAGQPDAEMLLAMIGVA